MPLPVAHRFPFPILILLSFLLVAFPTRSAELSFQNAFLGTLSGQTFGTTTTLVADPGSIRFTDGDTQRTFRNTIGTLQYLVNGTAVSEAGVLRARYPNGNVSIDAVAFETNSGQFRLLILRGMYAANASYSGSSNSIVEKLNEYIAETAPDPALTSLTVNGGSTATVPVGSSVTVDVEAKLASGAAISGATVELTNDHSTYQSVSPATATTGTNGRASFTITPTSAGTVTFFGSVKSAGTVTTTAQSVVLQYIATALSPSAGALSPASVGTAVSQVFTASGGTSPYTFAVTAGALPAGLTLASDGTLSGTPSTAGSYSFTVTATDGNGVTAASAYSLSVTAPVVVTLSPSAGALSPASVGTAVSQAFTASGGTSSYTFAVTAGNLPAGLTLASDGTLSGTPSTAGSYSFTVTATDGNGVTTASAYSLSVTAPVVVTLSPSAGALSPASVGTAVSQVFTASGGTSPYMFAVTAGALPPGVTLASDGTLSGTPSTAGSYSFTVTATDGNGVTAASAYSLSVTAPVVVTLSPSAGALSPASVGTAVSQVFTASGGTSPYTFAVTAGALPAGLTLASDGTLSGTPSTAGSYSFTVTATDGNGVTAASAYSLSVTAPVVVTLSPSAGALSPASVGTAVSQAFTASGGTSSYTFAVTAGNLPAGLTLASDGTLSGTPSTAGSYSFTVTATDGNGVTTASAYSLSVTAPVVVTLSPSAGALSPASVGTAVSQAFTASGGTSSYTFAVTAGNLPAGLTLASDGTLSGTPSTAGSYSFTVTATDGNGVTTASAYSLSVAGVTPSLALVPSSGALPDGVSGENYQTTLTAAGGAAPFQYSLVGGALPPGLTLNVNSGALNGPLSDPSEGDYTFDISVSDASGLSVQGSYSLKVLPATIAVTNKEIIVPPGSSPPNVNLARGATGGPFTGAAILSVEPSNSGRAEIVYGEFAQAQGNGAFGFYLKYTPNGLSSGQVRVRFTLTSSIGTSNIGVVTYNLSYDPVAVARDVKDDVESFVRTRQTAIRQTSRVPNLDDRRRAAGGNLQHRIAPNDRGVDLSFSANTNMPADESAAASRTGLSFWIDGSARIDRPSETGAQWVHFGMISLGADYLVSEKALLGLALHFDHASADGSGGAGLEGKGWLFGPYMSLEASPGVLWNSRLAYGQSANNAAIDLWAGEFTTTRWMAETALTSLAEVGEYTIASSVTATYFTEKVSELEVGNQYGDTVSLDDLYVDDIAAVASLLITREIETGSDITLRPSLEVELDLTEVTDEHWTAGMSAGIEIILANGWSIDGNLSARAGIDQIDSISGGIHVRTWF